MSRSEPESEPLLTIAVPTFNRLACLRETLTPLLGSGLLSPRIQLRVYDNASDDGTAAWLEEVSACDGVSWLRQPVNIGMEGNIADALVRSRGRYVWLMSDHMVLNVDAIVRLIGQLPQLADLDVEVIYARIASYKAVLAAPYTPVRWRSLGPDAQSRFVFQTGNISGLIVGRRLREAAARTVFRFAGFSYPHLGVYAHVGPETLVAETDVVSDFLYGPAAAAKAAAYNSYRSRFIGYPRALWDLHRLNPAIQASNAGLEAATGALRREVIALLGSDESMADYELRVPLWYYPWRIRLFLLLAVVLRQLPTPCRRFCSRLLFRSVRAGDVVPDASLRMRE